MLALPLLAGGGNGERGCAGEQWLVRMPVAHLTHVSVVLPLSAFAFCVSWSLLFNFDASTATHCGVWNLLPSISAAIGDFAPQCYVWRILLGLHSPPRLLLALAYLRLYRSRPPGSTVTPLLLLHRGGGGGAVAARQSSSRRLPLLAFCANSAEIGGLLVLSNVSSNENHGVHKLAFTVFILAAAWYMLLTCRLWSRALSDEERRSWWWKRRLAFAYLLSLLLAIYFYIRHNRDCEPGVYTLFALSEYVVVLSNIAFHWTAVWDFSSTQMLIGHPPPDKHF